MLKIILILWVSGLSNSQTHVSSMKSGDFFSTEISMTSEISKLSE